MTRSDPACSNPAHQGEKRATHGDIRLTATGWRTIPKKRDHFGTEGTEVISSLTTSIGSPESTIANQPAQAESSQSSGTWPST